MELGTRWVVRILSRVVMVMTMLVSTDLHAVGIGKTDQKKDTSSVKANVDSVGELTMVGDVSQRISSPGVHRPGRKISPEDARALKALVLVELKASSLETRRTIDFVAFVGSYLSSVGGYHALGGDDLARIVVPVLGPFLLLQKPKPGTPNETFFFRNALLFGSGIAQAAFVADYLISKKREKDLRKRFQVGVHPESHGVTLVTTWAIDP